MLPIITDLPDMNSFHEILKNNPGLVIIKFSAEWCGPCKLIKKQVDSYIKNSPDNVQFCVIDIDENIEVYAYLKNKKRVNGIPAMLCWYKGNVNYIPDDMVIGANVNEIDLFFSRCAYKVEEK